jgi:hypothetical protein
MDIDTTHERLNKNVSNKTFERKIDKYRNSSFFTQQV